MLIQPGSASSGTLAPVKISRKPKITLDSTAFSRMRRLTARVDQPEPGAREGGDQDDERERRERARGQVHAEDQAPDDEREGATNAPFRTTGSERPKKSGMRGAGLTRIALSVFW